jgi:hypothetical protein
MNKRRRFKAKARRRLWDKTGDLLNGAHVVGPDRARPVFYGVDWARGRDWTVRYVSPNQAEK